MQVAEFIMWGAMLLLLVGANAWQTILHEREKKAWRVERSRILDAALSHNSGDFRVRQTTLAPDGSTLIPRPNPRPSRPTPIGLDGQS